MSDEKPVPLKDILGGELYNQLLAEGAFDIKPFKPFAVYFPNLDMLYVLEATTSVSEQWIKGSNIELLWDNRSEDGKQLVGVKINNFSKLVPKEVIEVMHTTGMIRRGSPAPR